jgi:hypothetical protein
MVPDYVYSFSNDDLVGPLPDDQGEELEIILGLAKQVEEDTAYCRQLEAAHAREKEQNHQDLVEDLTSLRVTIEEGKVAFQQQMHETNLVLKRLTAGQTDILQSIAQGAEQHSAELAAMRDDISQLTSALQDLYGPSLVIATPPRLQQTESDIPLSPHIFPSV